MPRPAGQRILIVDDEPKIADTLALIFTSQGYEARVAYSSEDGIDIVAQWEPELAIIDVILPRMSGIDFAIVLRMNHPDCRILLFSAQPSTVELAAQAAKQGYIFEIVAKPVHPAQMLERAARLLGPLAEEIPGAFFPPDTVH